MPEITAENVSFSYGERDVLSLVSFSIKGPCRVAVLGANGSGKSTLLKLMDGLLPLRRGDILIDGISVRDEASLHSLRRRIGIVFQDPDSQFVSPVLEEDTAFGPENYGFTRAETEACVASALSVTGLSGKRRRSPQTLSGGEKERAQIAGITALSPDIVFLDEAFSMLDREGRDDMRGLAWNLTGNGILIAVTHSPDEALLYDRILLLSGGHLAADGTPREILTDTSLLRAAGVRPPFAVRVKECLAARGIDIGNVLTADDVREAVWRYL